MQYNLIIVTDPNKFLLEPEKITNIKNLLLTYNVKITNITCLADYEAYKLQLELPTSLYEDLYNLIKTYFTEAPVDFFLLKPSETGVKKLLISDMDSTLIKQECIDEIARIIGKYEEMQKITHQSMSGKLLFEDSLVNRVKLLANVSEEDLTDIAANKLEFSSGAITLAKTLNKFGFITAVASGGFTHFTKIIKKKLGFTYDFANNLEIKQNKLTGNLIMPLYGSNDKLVSLNYLIKKHNLLMRDAIAIGDGANDLPMLQSLDLGFSYHAKDIVKKSIKHQINHTGLTTLLFIQGIKRQEFVN